jgi:N utilization substance protein B
VEGVAANRAEIDELLASRAEHWSLERMASLDRTILRVACFELLHRPEVPPGVAVNEAVQMAKELSTEDSGRFVNGVLGTIARRPTEAE